ncbi:MAG: helix-turn-helix domain-containing protein [Candidatus Methylumidiphilus sp.]
MSGVEYQPVPFDIDAELAEALRVPAFREAYDALEDEFAALDALLQARREAGLTQAQVAERMGIKQSALARIESSLGSKKHSPTLETLRKYAEACGKRLEIHLR